MRERFQREMRKKLIAAAVVALVGASVVVPLAFGWTNPSRSPIDSNPELGPLFGTTADGNNRIGINQPAPQERLHISKNSLVHAEPALKRVAQLTNQPSNVQSIAVQGNYLYASFLNGLFKTYDISNPLSPQPIGILTNSSTGKSSVAVAGKYAYIIAKNFPSSGRSSFYVVDIGVPATPVSRSVLDISQFGIDTNVKVVVAGQYAYLLDSNRFWVVDVSNPGEPVIENSCDVSFGCAGGFGNGSGIPSGLAVAGKHAYVLGSQRFVVLDISDPENLRQVGSYWGIGGLSGDLRPGDLSAVGRYVYGSWNQTFFVFDVKDPVQPVGPWPGQSFGWQFFSVFGTRDYVFLGGGWNVYYNSSLTAVEVSDKTRPKFSFHAAGNIQSSMVVVSGRYLYHFWNWNPLYGTDSVLDVYDITGVDASGAAATHALRADAVQVAGNAAFRDALRVGGGFAVSGDATFQSSVAVGRDLSVYQSLQAPVKNFVIDHPLDPARKLLRHSFVESPDMKNFYDGIAVLDAFGEASVELPAYFEALNRAFRYKVTPVGKPAPRLYIEQEIRNNRFVIAGGEPGTKISWQVTGIRRDPAALDHPVEVESWK